MERKMKLFSEFFFLTILNNFSALLLFKINILSIWLIVLDLYPIEKYLKFSLNLSFFWKCMCMCKATLMC